MQISKRARLRPRSVAILGAVFATALIWAPGALASTLTMSGGTLIYTAASGQSNNVTFGQTGTGSVEIRTYDTDPISGSLPGICTPTPPTTGTPSSDITCGNVTALSADAGDMNDSLTAQGDTSSTPNTPPLSDIPVSFTGGDGSDQLNGGNANGDVLDGGNGNDFLIGGNGNTTLNGDAGDDSVFGGPGNDTVNGGDGNDFLDGGPGNDTVNGGTGLDTLHGDQNAEQFRGTGPAPSDNDTLNGGDDNDTLYPSNGTNNVSGGAGVDQVIYANNYLVPTGPLTSNDVAAPVNVSLDDQANDGYSGNNSNIHTDVEDASAVDMTSSFFFAPLCGPGSFTGASTCNYGSATLTGDSGDNALSGGSGNDTITGGGGADFLSGNPGNDTLNAVDGFPDRGDCGTGTDTANVDQLDQVFSCETVNTTQVTNAGLVTPATPATPQDKAPTIAWVAPAGGARMSTSSPNTLQVSAADDHTVSQVIFYDGVRTLCVDKAPPFTCAYRPIAGDIGNNVLIATAIDDAGLTATAVRTVTVGQFAATGLTASTSPKRVAHAPFRFTTTGRLSVPATVARSCTGAVAVTFKAGRKTISTRRVSLARNCTYRSSVTFSLPGRLHPKTLRVFVRFAGNEVLAPLAVRSYTVKTV